MAIGFGVAGLLYRLFYEGQSLTIDLGLELALIAGFVFVGAYVLGFAVFNENWPGLNFDNPLKDLYTSTEKERIDEDNPYKNDIPAIQTAWRIMQDARDEANGVERGKDNRSG